MLAAAAETAPTGMTVRIFDRVGEIPLFDADMTGVPKNLIDWASRPPRHVLDGRPAAIIGATPGRLGTVYSLTMLRIALAGSRRPSPSGRTG